jgi:hypothetical protein
MLKMATKRTNPSFNTPKSDATLKNSATNTAMEP